MKPALAAILAASALICAAQTKAPVIVIGIDGLGAAALRQSQPPAIAQLMKSGIWTLNARAVMPTVSSPNWASMIMGATPEIHGVDSNDWRFDKYAITPACRAPRGSFPTVFDHLKQRAPNLHTALIHDWQGFANLLDPASVRSIQHYKGSPATTDAAIEYLKTRKPDLLFIQLDGLDHAGHQHGWWTTGYREELYVIDAMVARIVSAARSTGPAYILLTGDHGGQADKKHGHAADSDILIPWILSGPAIPANRELTSVVSTADTAPTIAALLGHSAHPCWTGQPVKP
ncbi:MAG: alkaline phosphatase [Candidatus Solibacter sp.]|nr:alkaline phosphatase [Candidatus Solibacter sp.]